ncbi:MAG: rRNA maturation RNase YbeY [Pelolinea sp.]|nr:rRNA maturation RNase YbeY [Pelolinea sp.]
MINILRNDRYLVRINKRAISNKVGKALEFLKLSDQELTIAFESNDKLQELKNQYLGINETTDVLSFKSGDINPESGRIFLGDIVISPKNANYQAKEKNHSLEFELLTLCIHGLLHLLDYDHATDMEEKRMFDLQNELLGVINT